jgi:hypothetical protein
MDDAARREPGRVGRRVSAAVSVAASAVIVAALAGAFEPQRPTARFDLEAYYPADVAGGLTLPVALARLAASEPTPITGALTRCFARNDAMEERMIPASDGDPWYARGAQRIVDRVVPAMYRLAGVREGKGPGALEGGFLAWESDRQTGRILVMVDPTVLDVPSVRRRLNHVALRAYREVEARGPKVTVVVQAGCFTGADLAEARALAFAALTKATRDDPRRAVGAGLDGLARMDSRIHMRLGHGDRAWGEDLARRLGGRLAIEYEPLSHHY